MTKSIVISLLLVPFLLMGQSKTENFHFGLQFKPIIAAAYFDASDESAQWENYNFELSPRFGQSLGMIVRYHLSSTFSTETGLNLVNAKSFSTHSDLSTEMESRIYFDCVFCLLVPLCLSRRIFESMQSLEKLITGSFFVLPKKTGKSLVEFGIGLQIW